LLYKDLAATALIEEVATVKGKYETLASDHANFVSNSRDAFATLSIVALSAKEEVVTVRGKYETLASDHANVKREHEHDLAILILWVLDMSSRKRLSPSPMLRQHSE